MGGTNRIMAEEKTQENREDIIRVTGELKLINQKQEAYPVPYNVFGDH